VPCQNRVRGHHARDVGQQFPAECPSLHRHSSTLLVRKLESSSHELRSKNLIFDFEILDRRLLLPVLPPGEHHNQKVHREGHAHVIFYPPHPRRQIPRGDSSFWTPRAPTRPFIGRL
jgi:hypothetical protein